MQPQYLFPHFPLLPTRRNNQKTILQNPDNSFVSTLFLRFDYFQESITDEYDKKYGHSESEQA